MCGRYTMTDPDAILDELAPLGVSASEEEVVPRYNIAPSQRAVVVASDDPRRLVKARWGLVPPWAHKRKPADRAPKPLINARAETAATKPSFRDGVKRRRCLVVADGYYEWKADGAKKRPFYFRARNGRPFVFAGLWAAGPAPGAGEGDDRGTPERGFDRLGPAERSFAILTTSADALVSPIHDRMPVILGDEARQRWLFAAELTADDVSAIVENADPPALETYPVAPAVGSPANDDPRCVEPLPTQPELFGPRG